MKREKDLVRNTLILTIGTIGTKLISFILLPLYTGVLSTEEYGTVDLINTIISLLLPIVTIQIEQGVFRFLIDNRDNKKEQIKLISSSFFFLIIMCIIYLSMYLIISPFINNEYKYFIATNVIANVFLSYLLQIARGFGRNKEYSIVGGAVTIITILCNIITLVFLKLRISGMLVSSLISYLIGFASLFFKLHIYRYISITEINKRVLAKLIKYSLPLVPNSISWWIFSASDRVIVSTILGLSYTGILSISYKFSNIFIIIYNIFNMSWTESLSLHINDKDVSQYFNKTFNIILKAFYSLGLGFIAFMPLIFKILINNNYNEAYSLIPIAVIGSIFQVVVGLVSVVYVAKSNTKAIANTSIFSAVINIMVHFILIRFIGLYAAVISTLVSNLFFAIYRSKDVCNKYIKIEVDHKFLYSAIITMLIILLCYYSKESYCIIIGMLIASIYAYFVNRESLNLILGMFMKKIKGEN